MAADSTLQVRKGLALALAGVYLTVVGIAVAHREVNRLRGPVPSPSLGAPGPRVIVIDGRPCQGCAEAAESNKQPQNQERP